MAANKFASMLHTNTNRITSTLIYALLEWVLIAFLLLNSFFSYIIIKYADYFGLKKPCLWCARIDHIFEPSKYKNSCKDIVCDNHAKEISKLVFCSNHKKLAESQDMCEDCFSSSGSDCWDLSKKFAFFPWMKKVGLIQNDCDTVMENGEEDFKCSCCGALLEKKCKFPSLLIRPSCDVLDFLQKGNLISEAESDDKANAFDAIGSDIVLDSVENEHKIEENNKVEIMSDGDEEGAKGKDVEKEEKEEEFSCFISSFDCEEMVVNEDDTDCLVVEKDQVSMEREGGKGEGDLYISMDASELTQAGCNKEEGDINVSMEVPELTQVNSSKEESPEADRNVSMEVMGLAQVSSSKEESQEGRDKNVRMDVPELTQVSSSKEESPKEGDINVSLEVPELTQFIATKEESPGEGDINVYMDVPELSQVSSSKEESPEEKDVNVSLDDTKLTQVSSSKEESPEEGDKNLSLDGLELTFSKEKSPQIIPKHLDFYIEGDDYHLIPVELMDPTAVKSRKMYKFSQEDLGLSGNGDVILDFDLHPKTPLELVMEKKSSSRPKITLHTVHEDEDEEEDEDGDESEKDVEVAEIMESNEKKEATQTPLDEADDFQGEGKMDIDVNQVSKEQNDEIEAEISKGINIPDHEQNEYGPKDGEEDKFPDTPTSIDSMQLLHKKLPMLDRKESETEESLDWGVYSDVEVADGVPTVEKLKSVLKSERKALNALYIELEEERSASAVAANHTMAMINRLQEEKAAMQMEALQYQRMMEEQSEYDQEALQLLNELMVKREKEKMELEKELEVYRRKVQDYEAREKMIMLRRRKDDSSSPSATPEDSDGLSVDLNHEPKDEDCSEDSHQNTPANAVLYLEESLANFEEERLSILEQLKVLEEKLVSLNDDEEQHFDSITSLGYSFEQNGNGFHENTDFSYENGFANGHFKGVNGKHHQEKKLIAPNAKRLLPLFDAEIEDGILNGHENGFDSEVDIKRLAIEEEVGHVYERLQALEADREFLKHCISSLNKGDKGVYLLQEILQHLRDLRSAELRARTIGDAAS